jgi:hypothetical protein
VGASGHCRGCGALILWVRRANGQSVPYNPDGGQHLPSCPKASQLQGGQRAAANA